LSWRRVELIFHRDQKKNITPLHRRWRGAKKIVNIDWEKIWGED